MLEICPSILAGDFSQLAADVKRMEKAGAKILHIDVMDGHFVPNITMGPAIIKSLRDKTDMIFDVHLMISWPEKYIKDFVDAGAGVITFHVECESDIIKTIDKIKSFGIKAGISIKPGTLPEVVYPYLDILDLVLVMTVEPGFGGQAFMENMLYKIGEIRKNSANKNLIIQVDGGINDITAVRAVNAGADWLVAGTFLFGAENPAEEIRKMQNIL